MTGLKKFSEKLGVNPRSLKRMEIGFDGGNFTFPMRNGRDKIVGIRLRSGNKKFCVRGSKIGIFWPVGVEASSREPLYLCEGESDCAALLDIGLEAIGRPSCYCCTEDIKQFLSVRHRRIIIVADNDEQKIRPDGSRHFPGQEGALALAQEIKSIVDDLRFLIPSVGKDIREWINNGATKEDLLTNTKTNFNL